MTYDYCKRRGVTTPFVALDVLTGTVIGQSWRATATPSSSSSVATIDREVPERLQIHLILENYAPTTIRASGPCSRGTRGLTRASPPTSASRVSIVEICFARLSAKAMRRVIFTIVPALIDAIETYLAAHNDSNGPPPPSRSSRK